MCDEKRYCKGCYLDVTKTMVCACGEFNLTKESTIPESEMKDMDLPKSMVLYRYIAIPNSEFEDAGLKLNEYKVETETPMGYWITFPRRRWVNRYTKARFAYPTKAAALLHFIKRTEIRLGFLKKQITYCQRAMHQADIKYKVTKN